MSDFKKFCIDEKLSPVQIVGARKGWQEQQAKIDELQKENAALVHVIKSRDIQLENEKHEYDELVNKLVDSKMKNTKLQKRVDAALKLIESWNKTEFDKTTHWTEGYEEGCYHCAAQLEQALKGGDEWVMWIAL